MISPLAIILPFLAAVAVRAEDHLIVVGGPGLLAYTPSNITAAPGDTVTFEFHEKNHTVTQAAFASPCSPLAGADGSSIGFDSGFMPVPAGTTSGFPTYKVLVNDTKPIWAYCRQQGPPAHCGKGMVASINAPAEGNTFDKFKAAAIASGGSTTTTTASASWTSPPAPVISTVTATVTLSNSVYTTTYASWEGASPNPTPAAQPAVHTITVGGTAGLVFTPPNLQAAIGDTIQFVFQSKNHTATQSSFNNPCVSLQKSSNGATIGFDSGFMPVDAAATNFPTLNITVNDTSPIWGHCEQTNPKSHCEARMVFGINTPTSGPNTFAAFQALAEHSNVTTVTPSSAAPAPTGSTGSAPNGAGRTAISVGMSVGVVSVVVAALL